MDKTLIALIAVLLLSLFWMAVTFSSLTHMPARAEHRPSSPQGRQLPHLPVHPGR